MRLTAIAAVAVAIFAAPVAGQTPIDIQDASNEDSAPVHGRLMYELREAVERSERYTLAPSALLTISVSSIPNDNSGGSYRIASAVTVTLYTDCGQLFLGGAVITTSDRVREQTETILAYADRQYTTERDSGG